MGLLQGNIAVSRFRGARAASVSIEFALLVIPFLVIFFALVEIGVSFAARQVLANATEEVARDLQTGEMRPADATSAAVRAALCQKIQFMVSAGCPGLSVSLASYANFSAVPTTGILDATGHLASTSVSAGGTSAINQLNVLYRWPVITDVLSLAKSGYTSAELPLFATLTWQNEPFPL